MGWEKKYGRKLLTPGDAIERLKPGMRIFLGTACGEPQALSKAISNKVSKVDDSEIFHLLSLGVAPYGKLELSDGIRHNSFFIGPPMRDAVQEGRADYTPMSLSDIPGFMRNGRARLDAALVCVSPPDRHGFVSLGVSVDIVKTAIETSGLVIAEVNETMPRTLGDSTIHIDELDFLVRGEQPILEYEYPEPDEVQVMVARNVAELIDDGCTLETGIGVIPMTVLKFLEDRRDLGVHTEVMGDAMVDLAESGVITNKRKTIHKGKSVTSFCMGTKKLYDFINDNSSVFFMPTEHVNDPFIISQNPRMAAVNVALEVDITGQVAADSIGTRLYSGVGGQLDFIRGAGRSERGRPIICLPSTTSDGKRSRIAPFLREGAGVVTPRSDVHFVVTEQGMAYLFGKSIRDRALSLIQVAHPRFRDELLSYARENHYVESNMFFVPPLNKPYPKEVEHNLILKDRSHVFVRPLKTSDEDALKDFFYSLEDESLSRRFFTSMVKLSRERREPLRELDYDRHFAIGGFIGEPGGEELIGVANYVRDPAGMSADVAFVVRDDFQGKGLGKDLARTLADAAIKRGVKIFSADVLAYNKPVFRILHESGLIVKSRLEDGVNRVQIELKSPGQGAVVRKEENEGIEQNR
ncbi:MAG: GNAT family N-acetyltransferase [Deltaproteobacteria bacterium]|nr:GNAT family N-acetyltransferase [Deltaproteobacteria bacterium]